MAFGYLHWGAMDIAWTDGYKAEWEKAKLSPGFREAPVIRGQSFDRIVERMESSAHVRGDVAFYWFLTCAATVALGVSLLWMLSRAGKRQRPS